MSTQQSLFPITIQLSSTDALLLQELLPDLQGLGYQIELFGKDSFIVQGVPADILQGNEKMVIEQLLDELKHFNTEIRLSKREMLLRALARQQAVKAGTALSEHEMKSLINQLFNCAQPNSTPNGNSTFVEFKREYLEKIFGR